jgi:hypothetical protein
VYGRLDTRRAHSVASVGVYKGLCTVGHSSLFSQWPFSIKQGPIPTCFPQYTPFPTMQTSTTFYFDYGCDFNPPSDQPLIFDYDMFFPKSEDFDPMPCGIDIGSPFTASSPSSSGDDDCGTPIHFEGLYSRSVRCPLFLNNRTYLCSAVHSLRCISFHRFSPRLSPPLPPKVSRGKTLKSLLC